MYIYLVQHAEAKSKEEDPDRALTDIGRRNMRKTATFAARQAGISVDLIVHSGKTRARQSAEILAELLSPSKGVGESDGLNPNDDTGIWVKNLARSRENLILVGHLPHLGKLTAHLICENPEAAVVEFKNACMICLQRSNTGLWTVQWMIVPQLLP